MGLLFRGAFHDYEDGRYAHNQEEFDDIIDGLMEEDRMRDAPQPAPADEIASLPEVYITDAMLGETGVANCSICVDPVQSGELVTLMHCDHWFHGECITTWLNDHNTCPICRKSISEGLEEALEKYPVRRLEGVSGAEIPAGVLPPPRVPPRADGSVAAPLIRVAPAVAPGPAVVPEPGVVPGPAVRRRSRRSILSRASNGRVFRGII
jgi:hypothetical protein